MAVTITQHPIALTEGPTGLIQRGTVFLPLVVNQRPLHTNPNEQKLGSSLAYSFFTMVFNDARQLRPELIVCPHLILAAQMRVRGLVNGDPWAHVDQHGVTPNEYATAAGAILPETYPRKGNWLESLGAGSPNMKVMFDALANSPAHAAHMFGQGFFQSQNKIGIAIGEGGHFGWYLCLMISESACDDGVSAGLSGNRQ